MVRLMSLDRKSFLRRAAVVFVGGPVLLYVFYSGGWALLALLAVISGTGLWEYYSLAAHKGYAPDRAVGIGATLLVYGVWSRGLGYLTVPVLVGVLVASFLLQIRRGSLVSVMENTAVTLFGLFYCTVLPGHLLWFQGVPGHPPWSGIPDGRYWLIMVVLLVWTFDIFSYLVGSGLGRHKLFPLISPKKSWEGLLGGVVGLTAVFVLLVRGWGLTVRAADYAAVPLLAGLAALGGDVFESMLKRDAKVKDSSSFLPGHGGILDRFDALFLAGPVLYWYLLITRWLAGKGGA